MLKANDVRHIAIAPDLAPYGLAARQTLQSLGLWDSLKPKIVMGQNIGQTHSMVARQPLSSDSSRYPPS